MTTDADARLMDSITECLKFYAQHRHACSAAELACSCGLSQLRRKAFEQLASADARLAAVAALVGEFKDDAKRHRMSDSHWAAACDSNAVSLEQALGGDLSQPTPLAYLRKLQAVCLHLNISEAPMQDNLEDAIADVERAAEWARKHIEERGKQNDELREQVNQLIASGLAPVDSLIETAIERGAQWEHNRALWARTGRGDQPIRPTVASVRERHRKEGK